MITIRPLFRTLLTLTLGLCLIATGCKGNELDKKVTKPPKCDGNVLLEFGDITINAPRDEWLSWQSLSGEIIKSHMANKPNQPNPKHPLYDCSLTTIKDVWMISGQPINASVVNQNSGELSNMETSFQRHKYLYEEIKQSGNITYLPIGLEKFIIREGHEGYLVPSAFFKTANEEPVLIVCMGLEAEREKFNFNRCGYTYYVTPQIMLKNSFSRDEVYEDDFVQQLKKSREYFESLLVIDTGE